MGKMKVATQLGLGFGIVLVLTCVVAFIGISNIRFLNGDVDRIAGNLFPKTVQANNIIGSVNAIAMAMRNALILRDQGKVARQMDTIDDAAAVIKTNLTQLEDTITSSEGIRRLTAMKEARENYIGFQRRFQELVRADSRVEAEELLLGEIVQSQRAYLDAVVALIQYQTELMDEAGAEARESAQSATTQVLILSVIAVVVGIGVAIWIIRALMRRLGGEPHYAASMVQAIAAGDLSQTIETRPGDTASLLASLRRMQESLKQLVDEIAGVVTGATQGDFSKRLDLGDKQGFGKKIGEGLNRLAETTDVGLKDVTRLANALAAGDLSQTIERDYPGLFGQTKNGVNGTVKALTEVVEEIRRIVDAANRGDFSIRLELTGKKGFAQEIARLLNQLADTTEVGLKDVMRVSQALSEGDLTQTITKDYPGLFGETKTGVNATVQNLQQIVIQIKEAVDTVNTASNEIATGNQDLSQRTEEQASSLEETASSMEELTSTVKQNADNARQANQLAVTASDVAAKGGVVVQASVQTMAAISESSKKIADIIGVIDSIAFQTNILALNAAVEAARAGEQGRGFAVVAGEVRNLAQRSANAAKEIKALITDSVEKVDSGTEQVNSAGARMEEIVTSIKRVTDIMAEISAASDEQSAGIEQVNQAITQMDDVTQQNASLVEEATAAAEALEEQAQNLARVVGVFKMDGSYLAVAHPAASKPMVTRAEPKPVAKNPAPSKSPPARTASERPAPAAAPANLQGSEDEWEEF